MKWNKFFTLFGVTGSLAISNFFQPNLGQVQAQSSSKDALIVFVNGSGDCCAGAMFEVIKRVKPGNTVWTTSYANFKNGSTTTQVLGLSTNADALFITEAAQEINSQPASRPIVLIGHSYGGDSILKVLPFITRRVELVVVIDPVGTAGFRRIATNRVVPPNVDYFMNRWQENGLNDENIVPFDSRISGEILCQATKECDQTAQNLVRNEDGSEKRVECGWEEITCPGFELPVPPFTKGRKGTKAQRIEHNSMPKDAYIQKIVGDKISEVLTSFRPIASLPSTSPTPTSTVGNGDVFAHDINGSDVGTPYKLNSSTKVAANPQDKRVLVMGNRILVITDDGSVFAHDINGSDVGTPYKLNSSTKVAANPQDKRVLVVGNRILVIT